ncbi:hypothetical protein KKA27_02600, partial [Patescibacteria group bacterium]|nr:hypothetical protein [Patescibacteria group bacterium]
MLACLKKEVSEWQKKRRGLEAWLLYTKVAHGESIILMLSPNCRRKEISATNTMKSTDVARGHSSEWRTSVKLSEKPSEVTAFCSSVGSRTSH